MHNDQPFHSKGNALALRQVSWLAFNTSLTFPANYQWFLRLAPAYSDGIAPDFHRFPYSPLRAPEWFYEIFLITLIIPWLNENYYTLLIFCQAIYNLKDLTDAFEKADGFPTKTSMSPNKTPW